MATDWNDLKKQGRMPHDFESVAEPMPPPPDGDAGPMPEDDAKQRKGARILDHWRTLAELGALDTYPPRRRWLLCRAASDRKLEGVLPLGKTGLLVAQGGAGKTIALCQLALSVAATPDKPENDTDEARRARMRLAWLGIMRCDSPGRVLLALGEEDQDEVHRRMFNAARAMGLTAEDKQRAAGRIVALPLAGVPCAFVEGDGRGNVQETEALEAIRNKLAEARAAGEPFRLILLDPLSRWAGADTEKDNSAATRFVQAVESLATKELGDGAHGPTVIVAHHVPKAAKTTAGKTGGAPLTARGVSGLTDGARWEASLEVKREWRARPDKRQEERPLRVLGFRVTKNNYAVASDDETLLSVRPGDDAASLHALTDAERKEYEQDLREYDAWCAKQEKDAKATAAAAANESSEDDDDLG